MRARQEAPSAQEEKAAQGIAMFAWPGVGLLTLVYLVGVYAIVYGLITCMIAFRVHSLPRRITVTPVPPDAAPSHLG